MVEDIEERLAQVKGVVMRRTGLIRVAAQRVADARALLEGLPVGQVCVSILCDDLADGLRLARVRLGESIARLQAAVGLWEDRGDA